MKMYKTCNYVDSYVVFNVHLKELNLLLVGVTSCLGVFLRDRDGSDLPNNYLKILEGAL